MELLSILHAFTKDAFVVTAVLTVVFGLGIAKFLSYSIKSTKTGGEQQTPDGIKYDNDRTKLFKIHSMKFVVALVILYIGAIAWVGSEYTPYNPKKHGVPEIQTDSTRLPAEDMIPKK